MLEKFGQLVKEDGFEAKVQRAIDNPKSADGIEVLRNFNETIKLLGMFVIMS